MLLLQGKKNIFNHRSPRAVLDATLQVVMSPLSIKVTKNSMALPSWTPLSSSSLTDRKDYGLLTLPNGLVALLISDVPHLAAAEAIETAADRVGGGDDDDADESASSLPSDNYPSGSREEGHNGEAESGWVAVARAVTNFSSSPGHF